MCSIDSWRSKPTDSDLPLPINDYLGKQFDIRYPVMELALAVWALCFCPTKPKVVTGITDSGSFWNPGRATEARVADPSNYSTLGFVEQKHSCQG